MIFMLSNNNFDSDVHYYFEVPENTSFQEFKKICDESVIKVAKAILEGKIKEHYISWHSLIQQTIKVLESKGFKQVEFPAVEYFGIFVNDYSNHGVESIFDKNLLEQIIEFNRITKQ